MGIMVEIENGKVKGYETVKEFAKRLDVEEGTVRMWIKNGKIKALKIGDVNWILNGTEYPMKKTLRGKSHGKERAIRMMEEANEAYKRHVMMETEEMIKKYGGLREAARKTGIDPATLSKWKNGRQIPKMKTFEMRILLDES